MHGFVIFCWAVIASRESHASRPGPKPSSVFDPRADRLVMADAPTDKAEKTPREKAWTARRRTTRRKRVLGRVCGCAHGRCGIHRRRWPARRKIHVVLLVRVRRTAHEPRRTDDDETTASSFPNSVRVQLPAEVNIVADGRTPRRIPLPSTDHYYRAPLLWPVTRSPTFGTTSRNATEQVSGAGWGRR